LPLRAVGDLAMAAEVSWEDMVVITQCASLGKLPNLIPFFAAIYYYNLPLVGYNLDLMLIWLFTMC
jgi:hypothetical protein